MLKSRSYDDSRTQNLKIQNSINIIYLHFWRKFFPTKSRFVGFLRGASTKKKGKGEKFQPPFCCFDEANVGNGRCHCGRSRVCVRNSSGGGHAQGNSQPTQRAACAAARPRTAKCFATGSGRAAAATAGGSSSGDWVYAAGLW